jgi:hypothetical protein
MVAQSSKMKYADESKKASRNVFIRFDLGQASVEA